VALQALLEEQQRQNELLKQSLQLQQQPQQPHPASLLQTSSTFVRTPDSAIGRVVFSESVCICYFLARRYL